MDIHLANCANPCYSGSNWKHTLKGYSNIADADNPFSDASIDTNNIWDNLHLQQSSSFFCSRNSRPKHPNLIVIVNECCFGRSRQWNISIYLDRKLNNQNQLEVWFIIIVQC